MDIAYIFDGHIGRMGEENIRRFSDGASDMAIIDRRRDGRQWGHCFVVRDGHVLIVHYFICSSCRVVVLIVVFVGDVTVAVVGAVGCSFVATPGGDATRRLSMSIASRRVHFGWFVGCGWAN